MRHEIGGIQTILRRLRRDLKERGRSYDSVEKQYLESVRIMHLEFVEPSKRYADLIIPEGAQNNVALDAVIARVQAMVAMQNAAPSVQPATSAT